MYCKNCGEKNNDMARFCKKCGTELNKKAAEYDSESPTVFNPAGLDNTMKLEDIGEVVEPQPVRVVSHEITEENLPYKYKPLSAWAYFGYSLLFGVVPFGWIVAIVFAVGKTENVNLKNFARSFFCYLVVLAILILIIFGAAGCSLGALAYM